MKEDLQAYERIIKEANRCLNCKNPKCMEACPLSNNIPNFINEMKNENIDKAYEILRQTSILPEICGSICTKYCEKSCVLGIKSNPINIRNIEKYISTNIDDEKKDMYIEKIYKNKYKVAIIGTGPASISCAYYLSKNGYNVDMYEKEDTAGGILKNEIPEYRLDKKYVDKLIFDLIKMGVQIKYNYQLGVKFNLDELKDNYDAIFIGIGAQKINILDIEGKNLKNIYDSKKFLKGINREKIDVKGKNICVIGGR